MSQREPLIHQSAVGWYCTPCDEHHGLGDVCLYWAEEIADEINALPPRDLAALLDIRGPYDADDCPVCFDQDSTGCFACGGSGKREGGI